MLANSCCDLVNSEHRRRPAKPSACSSRQTRNLGGMHRGAGVLVARPE